MIRKLNSTEIEMLEKTQNEVKLEMRDLIQSNKKSMKSSLNRMDQVEDRISGLENKAGELDHQIKENDLEENS